ncbi:hypothetical protein MPH61_22430 [Peribacillus muralis]|uniref:hypothetical protein n=1 Tax=Peribacillus muralis TaxID=264697 RepID=UPI001F4DD06B|nr:hypothetical protein [Peribacillus muralis]MCK1995340.1 hypothetical protein [Peribacillus muralis]MCK2015871.1 hypothetical protein [Peribacillus muralis]
MNYKIRVYDLHTNKETIKVDKIFDTRDAAESAIEEHKLQNPDKYDYVKIPVKS